MMADFRPLCAELLSALESWSPGGGGPLEGQEAEKEARLLARARAALADEPAAPKGRESGAADLEKEFRFWWKETHGSPYFGAVPLVAVLSWTEYALDRWGNRQGSLDSSPPADGEVAELTGQLIEAANGAAAMGWDQHAQRILRAAELLQRQALPEVGE